MIPDDMPCRRDCAERRAGCAVDCEKWREYSARREEEYARRLLKKQAGSDTYGKRRLMRNLMIKEMRRK